MLSLEVCTQLSIAEFPKPDNWQELAFTVNLDTKERFYMPSLSHLIEACGEKFGVLERFQDGTFGAYIPRDCGINGLGKTPQEAVAKLWLTIQGAD